MFSISLLALAACCLTCRYLWLHACSSTFPCLSSLLFKTHVPHVPVVIGDLTFLFDFLSQTFIMSFNYKAFFEEEVSKSAAAKIAKVEGKCSEEIGRLKGEIERLKGELELAKAARSERFDAEVSKRVADAIAQTKEEWAAVEKQLKDEIIALKYQLQVK